MPILCVAGVETLNGNCTLDVVAYDVGLSIPGISEKVGIVGYGFVGLIAGIFYSLKFFQGTHKL
jgi:hypothetical protein